MHNNIGFENDYDCPVVTYGPPVGNTSAINADVYDLRWVLNFHSLFIEICGVN